jgi:hypothetical protein
MARMKKGMMMPNFRKNSWLFGSGMNILLNTANKRKSARLVINPHFMEGMEETR